MEHSNVKNKINGNPSGLFIPNDTFIYDYVDEYDKNFTAEKSELINFEYSNRC